MNTFDMLQKINEVFGRNYLDGTPEQQKINREIAKLLVDYRKSFH